MFNSLDEAEVIAKLQRLYLQKDYKPVSLWLFRVAGQVNLPRQEPGASS